MHVSLDGFVAGPQGEMNWIHVDEEIFDFTGKLTDTADTALYGRITYEMMENYWPTAADKPNASKHDIEHSRWYQQVTKLVLSNTLEAAGRTDLQVIGTDAIPVIKDIKAQNGQDILIFGSPSAAQALMAAGFVDEYWLYLNPIRIGHGRLLFEPNAETGITKLELLEAKTFSSGVVALHYRNS